MNKHYIIGNLVRDPETGTTESGIGWCRFTVAVNRKYKRDGQPEADFMQVTAWRGLGDSCAKYLAKGKKVAVIGESRAGAWTGRDGQARGQIEITADDVEFLSPGGSGTREPTDADAPGAAAPAVDPASGMAVVNPEDLPY
jgi:single-strand DNA-binding protein